MHTISDREVGAYQLTLVADTIETVEFEGDCTWVEVTSDGTHAVYFSIDGTDPTVEGNNTFELWGGGGLSSRDVQIPHGQDGATIKLISAGAPVISVARVREN